MQPRYGMGWMAKPPAYGQQQGTYAYNGPPAPPYTPGMGNQQTGHSYNSNDGYYGNQNNGYGGQPDIELQSPGHVYQPQRERDDYDAPMGPPPSKKGDGIIR